MKLIIDTGKQKIIKLSVLNKGNVVAVLEREAEYSQAERLLPAIEEILKNKNYNLSDIQEIVVNNQGDSFTALRIGIVTANTLGYALNIPVKSLDQVDKSSKNNKFSIIAPKYNKEPNITKSKKKKL